MDRRTTILVVDDEKFNRDLCKTILKDKGFSVLLASNGRKAVEQCQRHNPDVVLMDVQMPEMNGIEALKIIKASNPNIRVIMMSGNPYFQDRCLVAGAESFFTKPFSFRDILAKIGEILRTDENANTRQDS